MPDQAPRRLHACQLGKQTAVMVKGKRQRPVKGKFRVRSGVKPPYPRVIDSLLRICWCRKYPSCVHAVVAGEVMVLYIIPTPTGT